MKTLYLESVSGVAGDMFAAAFVDAGLLGAGKAEGVSELLGLPEVRVETSRVRRAEVAATHLRVLVEKHDHGHEHQHAHPHTHYPELDGLLEASRLPGAAKAFSRRVYRLLAEAEARAHGCSLEQVAFHEVGDLDSVVDVALAGLCVAEVAPERVVASPVRLGRGTVHTRHGAYPVPPPASAHLAEGMPVAAVPSDIPLESVELSTPTGLAILKALEPTFRAEWPGGVVRAQGFGAGTLDLGSRPNVFRVVLLEEEGRPSTMEGLPFESGSVVEIECNVDDQTGERSGWLIQRSLELGALDAWITPVVGKKGRPASCFTMLCTPATAPRLADWLLRHSATFGLRWSERDRLMLTRTQEIRATPHGTVRFSVGRTKDGGKVKEKPEFDDLAEIWKKDPDYQPASALDEPLPGTAAAIAAAPDAPAKPVNLQAAAAALPDLWSPKVVARVGDHYVKVARVHGEFVWHAHEKEDELFLVLRGKLRIRLEGGDAELGPGDTFVVPAGTRHMPVAEEECWLALVEPVETKHTGDVVTERTRSIEEQLR